MKSDTNSRRPDSRRVAARGGHCEALDLSDRVRKSVDIRPFEGSDEAAVVGLWERCDLVRPWNDPRKDIQRKLRVAPRLFLVGLVDAAVAATVMAGYEGHRGWINYLAVAPEHRRKGLGRAMMVEAEGLLAAAGCPKVNLQIRGSNPAAVGFYRRLGYEVDDVISLGKRLEQDG